jgi:PAS domain S-box-containing protein
MKLHRASDWIAAVLLGLTALGSAAVWQQTRLTQQARANHSALRAATVAAADLDRGTTALTEAMRAYAATGEPRYLSAFQAESLRQRTAEKAMDRLVKSPALGLTAEPQAVGNVARAAPEIRPTDTDADPLSQVRLHSAALIELHNRAGQAVATGNRPAAQALLHSAEYEAGLQRLREHSGRVQELVRQRSVATAAEFARQNQGAQQLVALALLANAVTVAIVLVGFYRRRVIKPLAQLAERLDRHAAGEPGVSFEIGCPDNEIGRIARTLQHLSEAEAALRVGRRSAESAEAWYRHIIDAAPDGMMVVDAKGIILLANPEIHRIFGYGPQQLIGASLDTLVPGDVRARHAANRERFMQASQGRVERLQGGFMAEHRSGAPFAVELSLTKMPAMDEYGTCVCVALRRAGERQAVEGA